MFFPDVPIALGVPSVPRIPTTAISLVSQGLGGAAFGMNSLARNIALDPLALLSSVSPQMADISATVLNIGDTLGSYPSALFNQFLDPVGQFSDTLGSITSAIGFDPSGPVSGIAGLVGVGVGQSNILEQSFQSALDQVDGLPSLDNTDVESVTVTAFKSSVQWGIVKDGESVIEGDNFVSLEFKRDWVISDYPLEKGAFESFNKVEMPYDARVTVSCGGSLDAREGFLNSVKAISGTLEIYDIVTPEETLESVNVGHVDYKRTNLNGVGLIVVCIYLIEIRENAEADFSAAEATPDSPAAPTSASPTKVKSPAAAKTRSNGTTQIKPVLPAQATKINEAINALVPGL